MRDIQLIPGPLHPDLFGGETPIMLPCDEPLNEFSVEVCWPSGEEIECRRHTTTAHSHEEAARQVLSATRRSTNPRAEVVDVQCRPATHESESRAEPEETPS